LYIARQAEKKDFLVELYYIELISESASFLLFLWHHRTSIQIYRKDAILCSVIFSPQKIYRYFVIDLQQLTIQCIACRKNRDIIILKLILIQNQYQSQYVLVVDG
jgi:hypothetical protein